MAMRISARDLETLSAYLDGQLTAQEQARLETRLQSERNLREALERLVHTRMLLRTLPKRRAPRNFTLTPQMVGVQSRLPRSYPVFRLASALASFLLVLALLGDFLFIRNLNAAPMLATQSDQAPAAMLEALQAAPVEATEGAVMEVPPAPAAQPTQGAEVKELASEAEQRTMTSAGAGPVTEQPPPAPMLESAPLQSLEATQAVAGEPVEEAAEPSFKSQPPVPVVPERTIETTRWAGLIPLRVVEVILAFLAVATALVAVYLRRKAGPIRRS